MNAKVCCVVGLVACFAVEPLAAQESKERAVLKGHAAPCCQ